MPNMFGLNQSRLIVAADFTGQSVNNGFAKFPTLLRSRHLSSERRRTRFDGPDMDNCSQLGCATAIRRHSLSLGDREHLAPGGNRGFGALIRSDRLVKLSRDSVRL